jgi:hypothetical protein
MRTEETDTPAMAATADARRSQPNRGRWIAAVAVAAVGIVGLVVAATLPGSDEPSRQQTIAERGADVMPFDLDATTHVFNPTEYGGIQTVVADDPTNREQIELVRFHLQEEVARFRVGDFGDPETIHGDDMPCIAVLEANFAALETSYRERADDAEVTYRSSDPAVVTALHDWFDAQLSDHGTHAQPG